MEAATFLVCEKGFNPQPFRIQATCLVCGRQIREQIQWLFIPFGPATEEHAWPISLCRNVYILQRDESAGLDTGGHRLAPKVVPLPLNGDVAPCADHVGPVIGL